MMDNFEKEILESYKKLFKYMEDKYKQEIVEALIKQKINIYDELVLTKKCLSQDIVAEQYLVSIKKGEDFKELRVNSRGKVIGLHFKSIPFILMNELDKDN